jgi:hypothetical protein
MGQTQRSRGRTAGQRMGSWSAQGRGGVQPVRVEGYVLHGVAMNRPIGLLPGTGAAALWKLLRETQVTNFTALRFKNTKEWPPSPSPTLPPGPPVCACWPAAWTQEIA